MGPPQISLTRSSVWKILGKTPSRKYAEATSIRSSRVLLRSRKLGQREPWAQALTGKKCPFHTSSSCLLKFRKRQKTLGILTIFGTPSCPTRSQHGPQMVSKIKSKKYKFCFNTCKTINVAIAITCVWHDSQCSYWNLEVLHVLGKWAKILSEKIYLLSIANTSNL